MRTIQEHRAEISALVDSALADRKTSSVSVAVSSRSSPGAAPIVLAADVLAPIDLPPFDNSQMDGYAVVSADLRDGPVSLEVGRRIPAGRRPDPLPRGIAAPIMTGAPLPQNADAVIQIERADPPRFLGEEGSERVVLPGPVPVGQFVRATGSDIRRGDLLVAAGTRLRPPHFGVLAAAGVDSVEVVSAPRILLVSTGSELSTGSGPLGEGAIHDANGASLGAALAEAGAEVWVRQVADDGEALLALVREYGGGESSVDLIVTTGGVSEGAYEVVRETFSPRGVTFGAVAMQPGGPQGWGVLAAGDFEVPVVCFPGNPVSALISFEAFLREPVLRAAGLPMPDRETTAILAEGADSPPGKHQLRRGRLDDEGRVRFVGGPSSHLLHAYAQATHLVHVPLGVSRVEAGDEVVVWALDD